MTPPCPRRRSSDLVDGRLVACGRGGGAFGLRFLRGERRGEGADAGENQHGAAALTGPAGFGHIHCITPHILSLSDQSASVSIGAAASGAGPPRSARCSASRSSAFSHPATTIAARALPPQLVSARRSLWKRSIPWINTRRQ